MSFIKEIEEMHYEGDCIRPPSEGNSILLQVTVGCSHNQCTFCGTFKKKRFRIKDENIILNDILFAARYLPHRNHLFLMDGDALIIPQKRLLGILEKIREHLPWVKKVGAYANTKSIEMKSLEELKQLREKGLSILYYGVETGDDEIRKSIRKGSTSETCLEMGRRAKEAGIKLSVTVILGIGGCEKSLHHARVTGQLLTAMDPDYVGALSVMFIPETPLTQDRESGKFVLPDEAGLLRELREMITYTDLTGGLFFSNHACNYLPVKAMLPQGKQAALDLIDAALKGDIALRPEWMRAI